MLLFLGFQVVPQLEETATSPAESGVMDREAAQVRAVALAEESFGVAASDIREVQLTHFSDSDAVGYLSREKLMDDYDRGMDEKFPTDVYRSDIRLTSGDWLQLSLHMETGKLVAWRKLKAADAASGGASNEASDEVIAGTASSGSKAGNAPAPNIANAAIASLSQWGYEPKEWEPTGQTAADGAVVFQSRKSPIGEARIQLLVKPGEELAYRIVLPQSFKDYMKSQKHLASTMTAIGYVVPEIILFALAVVYAATYSGFTSFKRGWFLSALYFVLYVLFTLNMKAGFRSSSETGLPVSDQSVLALLIVNAVILAATAALTYFAAVGGDGLWRLMGYSLWPRWREDGYGRRVLRSMRQGYALAFIALGSQSVILFVLTLALGSFTSSDTMQSSYNMTHSWLMPLIALCAGLSEELLYRYFGIGLFRRWLTGIARKLLRREPSRRAAGWLTLAAMIPPSVIWAFGHVGYPIYPVYTRLIELTLLGLLFGWFMLRFGLMTAIFAHITLDAMLVGVQLMFDELPFDLYSGIFSMLMPAIAGGAIWLLYRLFRRDGGTPFATPTP